MSQSHKTNRIMLFFFYCSQLVLTSLGHCQEKKFLRKKKKKKKKKKELSS